jgi:Pyridoxamine 5'-phosphate oxidase
MARWADVESEAPELAALARRFLDGRVHRTLATLRRDGSPRISGTEARFAEGELWLGSMWRSMKALDLRRDPRFALHSGSEDPPSWSGDATVSGRAVEVDDDARKGALFPSPPPGPFHLFRADLGEVLVVRLGEPADHLIVEIWRPGMGVTRKERR